MTHLKMLMGSIVSNTNNLHIVSKKTNLNQSVKKIEILLKKIEVKSLENNPHLLYQQETYQCISC